MTPPTYRWDLYECDTMDVQKGLGFCLRLSLTLYCHGLPVPKEKKKTLKQYKSVTSKLCGCSFGFCDLIKVFRAILIHDFTKLLTMSFIYTVLSAGCCASEINLNALLIQPLFQLCSSRAAITSSGLICDTLWKSCWLCVHPRVRRLNSVGVLQMAKMWPEIK